MNLSDMYSTTAREAAVPESVLNKYCAVAEFEAGPLKGLRTACGSAADADATSCPDCGLIIFGVQNTARK